MLWNKIYDIKTKKFICIHSAKGKLILMRYLKLMGGGKGIKKSNSNNLKISKNKKMTKSKHKKSVGLAEFSKLYKNIEKSSDNLWNMGINALQKKDWNSLKIISYLMILSTKNLPNKMKNISHKQLFNLKIKQLDKFNSIPAKYMGSSNTISIIKPESVKSTNKFIRFFMPKFIFKYFVEMIFIVFIHEMVHFTQNISRCIGGTKTNPKNRCWLESQATTIASEIATKYGKTKIDNLGKKALHYINKYTLNHPKPFLNFLDKCYYNKLEKYTCNNSKLFTITRDEIGNFRSSIK